MAESAAARVKAAQIRQKLDAGKPVSTEHKRFLDDYIKRTGFAKAKELPAGPSSPPSGRVVQSTTPQNDNVDPATHTWVPTIPIPLDDAPPPPPGATPPPTPGSPVIDATAPAPTGDPAAAAQAAAIIALITKAGIKATVELLADVDMPAEARAILVDPNEQNQAVMFVAAAAHRLAIKYNLKSLPMTDEVVVAIAVAGSGAAWMALRKKHAKAKSDQRKIEKEPEASVVVDKPVTPPGFSWGS